MHIRRRRLWLAVAAVLLVAAGAALIVRRAVDRGVLRAAAETRVSAMLGQAVTIGHLRVSLLPAPALIGSDIRVGPATDDPPALDLGRIRIVPRLRTIFGSPIVVSEVTLERLSTLKAVRATNAAEPVRQWLLAVQVALAVVLTAGAVLFGATLRNLTGQDMGFRPANVLLMHLDIQRTNVAQHERTSFYRLMLDRLAGVPGVESVAACSVKPDGRSLGGSSQDLYAPPGRPA